MTDDDKTVPMFLNRIAAGLGALVLFLGLTCSCAQAEPVQLACTGQMTAAIRQVTEDSIIALTIDLRAKTATVGGYGTVPILGDSDGDTVVFMTNKNSIVGVSTGTINRITGVASIHIITLTDGLYMFYGVCKPAQKLF
jgi:hypothetical protein